MPNDMSQSRAEIIRQFLPTSPYVGHLGMQLTDMQPDMAVLTLPFERSLVTIGNTIHGGAIASLIDTAAMVAAWSDTTVVENLRGTTVGLTVSYPGQGGTNLQTSTLSIPDTLRGLSSEVGPGLCS